VLWCTGRKEVREKAAQSGIAAGKTEQLSSGPETNFQDWLVMASLQTFFRTVVMLATLAIVAKFWFLYGPNMTEMKSIGSRLVELSGQAWSEYWKPPTGASAPGGDSQLAGQPAPFVPPTGSLQPIPLPPVVSTSPGPVQLASRTDPPLAAPQLSPAPLATGTGGHPRPSRDDASAGNDRLVTDVERLAALGVRDQQLKPWGRDGALYRCSCDAPWVGSPNYSRHFESVAASAEAAIEQVADQVAAWQSSQRTRGAGQ
jgi:hypothetical protein